jgi:hypothetical protein
MKIGEEKNEEIAEVRKKETDEKKEKNGPRAKKKKKREIGGNFGKTEK